MFPLSRGRKGHKNGKHKSMPVETGLSRPELDLRLALAANPAFLLSLVLPTGLSLDL